MRRPGPLYLHFLLFTPCFTLLFLNAEPAQGVPFAASSIESQGDSLTNRADVSPTTTAPKRRQAFFEFGPTLFESKFSLEDRIPVEGGSIHWFSVPKTNYTGFYLGGGTEGTLGFRGGVGMGKERLRVYLDGGNASIGPVEVVTLWFYADFGASLGVGVGPFSFTPSAGLGCLFSSLTMEDKRLNLSDEAGEAHPFVSFELPIRVWFTRGFGAAAAYHRIVPVTDPTFGFSDDTLDVDGSFGNAHEIRAGFCVR